MLLKTLFVPAAVVAMSVTAAHSAMIEWSVFDGGNGYFYEAVYIPQGLSWESARVQAEALGGHLVTLTSQEENDWVFANVGNGLLTNGADPNRQSFGPWIGLFQNPSSPEYSEPSGGWEWVTGEQFAFAGWGAPSPNDDNGSGPENYAHYVIGGPNDGLWNDSPLEGQPSAPTGFVVEYVPSPGSGLALVAGCSLLGRRRI